MNSAEYWKKRSEQRLIQAETSVLPSLDLQLKIYRQSESRIKKEIESIYKNYGKKYGDVVVLDKSELQKAIGNTGRLEFLKKTKKAGEILGIDPEKIYDERYLSRLTRLESIQSQVQIEIMAIAQQNNDIWTKQYTEVLKNSYQSSQNDMLLAGNTPTFSTINKETINQVLNSSWVGDNYSNRIWKNTSKLANRSAVLIGESVTTGTSLQKVARDLRDEFGVSMKDAMRLARTESNYMHNQAEAQSLIDDGFEFYEIDSTIDNKTSDICRKQDGQVYELSKMKVGFNAPPFHPNCRTTITYALELKEPPKTQDTSRLTPVTDDLQSAWKTAMQKQMTQSKTEHDYNADMNKLTQTYKGDELISKIDALIKEMPTDYNLANSIKMVAKMYGWK